MDKIIITGGRPLQGAIPIAGAKNACLTLMPATLLTEDPLTLINVPRLSDMRTMAALLQSLGVEVSFLDHGRVVVLSSATLDDQNYRAPYDIVRKMRASILLLGPLLARHGRAEVSLPGGCAIGARPVDLHLMALKAMGARLDLREGYVHAQAPRGGLRGAVVAFPSVSVGATENALLAAVLARGTTVLKNVAREPEITDLATCLRGMGAQISGDGSSTITIEGVARLRGATHRIVPDRIELGTYMMLPALCGGAVECLGGQMPLVQSLCESLQASGLAIEQTPNGIKVSRNGDLQALDVITQPYPGFPTDLQAQMMVLMCMAQGVSTLKETIFENRFMHVPELRRMGADIAIKGNTATVKGGGGLRGAPVMATDLRASVSLILGGLAAQGRTVVNRVYHLEAAQHRCAD